MEIAHLNQLIALEDRYWWHVSKRRWVTQLLKRHAPPPSRVIEGGIGGAGNLLQWQRLGYSVAGLDCMPESIENAKSLGLEQVYQHDLHDPWPLSERSDAIILLDVLEHLRDPVLALRNAAKCLSDTGRIIFTVPAYPWLFSEWDERLGHFRRYTSSMVRGHAEEAGLRLLELSHWNAFTFPVACLLRWVRRIRPTSKGAEFPKVAPWMNHMLLGAATLERGIGQKVPIPFGLSLAGVFAK